MTAFSAPPPFATGAGTEKVVEEVVEEIKTPEAPKAPEKTKTKTEREDQMTTTSNAVPNAPKVEEVIEGETKEKKKIKKNKVQITTKHIRFVQNNIKTMGYGEMADSLDITRNQINRILQTLKEGLREKAVENDSAAYGTKTNKKGETVYDWSSPQSEMAKKVENKIQEKLSRPADTRPGGGGGGKVKKALDSELNDLLADL